MRGTSTLLVGGPGSGKTFALATFVKAGIEVFCVFTEPGGEEAILQAVEKYNLDINMIHWCYIAPASPSFETMLKTAKIVGSMSYEALTKIKSGVEKAGGGYNQFLTLLEALADFKCERTGKSYGPVDSWDSSRALALDSLSGLNIMAMDLIVGGKPVKHQGEWGVAMDSEERLVSKLCCDIGAFFVLTAHLEREQDELTGAMNLMAGALGRKLAPRLPRFFSDVVHAYREGDQFFWSTITANVDTKARTLPLSDKLTPSFEQVVEAWRKRAETAAGDPSSQGASEPLPEVAAVPA